MKNQDYKHHKFYYWPHHVIFYGCILILNVLCFYALSKTGNNTSQHCFDLAIINLLCFLALMLRQHYALGNQNRIIRLEMRLRYYVLTQKRFEVIEEKLSRGQIFALRFASDEELIILIDRCLKENLSPDAIKSSIKNWQADHMRV